MNDRTILTRRGYIVIKNKFKEKELINIKKKLTVKPFVHRDYNKFVEEFPVYYENENKLYLPRFWGLEHLGEPDKCNLIDGVRIEFESGWGLIRSSNTQPVIVCRFEADNQSNLNKIKKIVFDKIQEYGDIKIEF